MDDLLSARIRVTGYVDEAAFDACVAHCDLVLNLRYPVMGETSAALLRAFAFGKPCVVTDAGWFSELAGNIVLKLDAASTDMIEAQLIEAIRIFLDSPEPFRRMGEHAAAYVRERHSATAVARHFFDMLTSAQ